jgi:UDP-2,3-diacylglucosamine pyrophosphatase LpxH
MPVTWLHISDFHLQSGDKYDRDVVLRTLVKSVKHFRERKDRVPDLIFATGDIAFSGKPDEYKLATEFFDDILEAAGLQRTNLFVVPGNHDVDRQWGVQLNRTLNSRGDADDYFVPGIPKLHLTYKLGAFVDWYSKYFSGIRELPKDSTCGPVEVVDVRGQRLGILPINSSLFCQDDTDHDKLFVGRRCLNLAVEDLKKLDSIIRIALLHHPLDWLSSFERQNIRSSLIDHVDVILQGHLHEAGFAAVSMSTGRNLYCAAGAAYQTRQRPNTAYYATFKEGQVEVFPVCYIDQPRETWTLDTSLFPDEPGHVMSFPVPRDPNFRSFKIPILEQKIETIDRIAAYSDNESPPKAKRDPTPKPLSKNKSKARGGVKRNRKT